MKPRSTYTCPLELTHDIIKGKWKPMILWQLSKSDCSLSQLKAQLDGVSQKVLIQQLQELMEYQIIEKTKSEGYPLSSNYRLSSRGIQLFEIIDHMQSFGLEIMKEDTSSNPL